MARPIVLCVQNDPTDSLGIAPPLLREAGCDVTLLRAFDESAAWPAASGLAGLVVFGGEMNADQLDRYPYLLRVRRLMREMVDRGVPTLGICLGSQLLARAFGARVYPAPVRELGFVPIVPTAAAASDPLLAAVESGDRLFQWHEDTFDLAAGATLLATGQAALAQAYRLGSRAWGVQFHPEVDVPEIQQWLRDAGSKLESKWGRTEDEVMAEVKAFLPAQERRARALFARYAVEVGSARGP